MQNDACLRPEIGPLKTNVCEIAIQNKSIFSDQNAYWKYHLLMVVILFRSQRVYYVIMTPA